MARIFKLGNSITGRASYETPLIPGYSTAELAKAPGRIVLDLIVPYSGLRFDRPFPPE